MTSSGLPSVSAASSSGASSSGIHPPKTRLNLIKRNLDHLASLNPNAVIHIIGQKDLLGQYYPVDGASQFFPDEFFERVKEVNAASLEPTHSVQAMRQIMKKGVPESVLGQPHPILINAAIAGSEKLFRLPWKYGARPLEREESQALLNRASQLFSQELERIRNLPPEGAPPEDWKKWMTLLKLRMRARIIRMNVIANGYAHVHRFLNILKERVFKTSASNQLKPIEAEQVEAEKKASSALTKSARRKARKKAKQAQAAALEAMPSGSGTALNHPDKTRQNPAVSFPPQPEASGAPSPIIIQSRKDVQPEMPELSEVASASVPDRPEKTFMMLKASPFHHSPESMLIPNPATLSNPQERFPEALPEQEITLKNSAKSKKETFLEIAGTKQIIQGKKQVWRAVGQRGAQTESSNSPNLSSETPVLPTYQGSEKGKKQVWRPVGQRGAQTKSSNSPNSSSEKPVLPTYQGSEKGKRQVWRAVGQSGPQTESSNSPNPLSETPVLPTYQDLEKGKRQVWRAVGQRGAQTKSSNSPNSSSEKPVLPTYQGSEKGKRQVWRAVGQRDAQTESSNSPNSSSETPVSPTYQDLTASSQTRHPEHSDHPDQRLPYFDVEAAGAFLQNRWQEALRLAENSNSGVVVYSSSQDSDEGALD